MLVDKIIRVSICLLFFPKLTLSLCDDALSLARSSLARERTNSCKSLSSIFDATLLAVVDLSSSNYRSEALYATLVAARAEIRTRPPRDVERFN